MKIGTILVALLAVSPLAVSLSLTEPVRPQAVLPAPAVRSSHDGEAPIHIPLVNPHYPINIADEASTLAADVNAARAEGGLPALKRDDTLDRFAYAKAVDMAARGYFGHTDTDGITFHDRMQAWHYPTPYAAENIAFDRNEPNAHSAFMHSPPHAQNVMDRNQRKIGVAVVSVGDGETFYVEDFSGN
ncbi:MAG: hypothetical protein NVS3B7_07750 [Candidatus Elarobacter sp.]